MRRAPLLALAALLIAGCTTPAPVEGTPTPAPGADAREPVVTTIPVSLPAATPVGEPADSEQGTFDVPEGANETLVEARWTCTSPTCGFVLLVYDSEGTEEGSETGEGEAVVTEALGAGTYTAALASTGPAANMAGEIRVTTFFGPIPEGYSAFDA